MVYKVKIHIGPVNNYEADRILNKVRSHPSKLPVGCFMVGTESLYMDVRATDKIDAIILTQDFLKGVFGSGTGLVSAIAIIS